MLALSRKTGDVIVIPRPGGDIYLHVLEVSGGRVRFGFDAPMDVAFYRREIWDKMTQQQKDTIRKLGKAKEKDNAECSQTDEHDPDLAV